MNRLMVEKRKERKMTQAELAQAVGVSQRAIASYEAEERRPSVETAKKIGAELQFPWTEFFGEAADG